MNRRIPESTLIAYLVNRVDPATRQLIAEQRSLLGSPIQKWFEQMDAKLRDPANVDWLTLMLPEQGDVDPKSETVEPTVVDDAIHSDGDEPFEIPLDSFDPATAAYFQMELSELRSELSRYSTVYRSDVLAPYRAELRQLICTEWKWDERRNNPSYRDERVLASELSKFIAQSGLSLPFPIPLVAAILIREGLDDFCDPFR